MTNDQLIRFKTLDRCFRDIHGCYDIDDLIRVCTEAIKFYHADPNHKIISKRTIEKDLEDLKVYHEVKFRSDYTRGRKKLYQYEDTNFSLMKKLLDSGELENNLFQEVLDTLTLYSDVPQYKWLYVFLQQCANGNPTAKKQSIEFQNNPDLIGMEHFGDLVNAILNKQTLRLSYKAYGKEMQSYIIHPYLLKQYNNRWFLIARNDGYDNITNYAIDRIKSISSANIPFQPAGIDLIEYFDPVVGVSRNPSKEVVNVMIRIANRRYPYVMTKPFHHSQTEIHSMADETSHVIRLQVQINNELEAMILSLGNDAEVLSPLDFRERIAQKIDDLQQIYRNSANVLRK